jgi:hypothetical protein
MDLEELGYEDRLNIYDSTQEPDIFKLKIHFRFKKMLSLLRECISFSRSSVL